MSPTNNSDADPMLKDPADFSLVLGGPLFQFLRRTHLSGVGLELLHRRIVAMILLAWVPLLVLSIVEGTARGGAVQLPFFHDIEVHSRLLIAMPLLVVAEWVVHERMRPVVRQFIDRKLISEESRSRFEDAVGSAMRLRNSVLAELLLIAVVYFVGVGFIWRKMMIVGVTNWHGVETNGGFRPSLAGWWLACVSLPMFQFLLLRWYFRLFVWTRFLWQVSRMPLNLMPTHPDRCGGLGFLSNLGMAFAPVLLAQGSTLAGLIADRIFFAGKALPDFKLELIALAGLMVFTVLGPLVLFIPQLGAARRKGTREYGILAQRYAIEFDRKWLRGGAAETESLLGSADIQSLADLGNSYSVVTEMKAAPFTTRSVVQLGMITLLPVAPLMLTMIPLEELIERLLKVVL